MRTLRTTFLAALSLTVMGLGPAACGGCGGKEEAKTEKAGEGEAAPGEAEAEAPLRERGERSPEELQTARMDRLEAELGRAEKAGAAEFAGQALERAKQALKAARAAEGEDRPVETVSSKRPLRTVTRSSVKAVAQAAPLEP